MNNAYWISPNGKTFDVDTSHIDFIFENPDLFGTTRKYMEKLYSKYKERLGQEGKAREDIMIEAMKKGWLRARFTQNRGWIIQSYFLNKRNKDNIWDFISYLFNKKKTKKYDTVTATSVKDSGIVTSSAEGILKGDLYESNEYLSIKNKILERMSKFNTKIKLKEMVLNSKSKSVIMETKLSRIWKFISDENYSFGIISAFRGENSPKENERLSDELLADIRKNYGYIPLKGGFVESEKEVIEKSFLVPKITESDLVRLGIKYDQYSVIYKDKNSFVEIGTNSDSGINTILNRFSSDKRNGMTFAKELVKKYFSSLLFGPHMNRKFNFVLYERESASFNRIAYNKNPLKWKLALDEIVIEKE